MRGGNPALLRACRRLGVPLPASRRDWVRRPVYTRTLRELNPLHSYIERIAGTKALMEEEAVTLWECARSGDREAQEELLVRARPMVKFVIEEHLHEELSPSGFKDELLWHLISEGDLLISATWPSWEHKGRLLGYLHNQLRDGLRQARMEFFKERYRRQKRELSMTEPIGAGEAATAAAYDLEKTDRVTAPNLPPDEVTAILGEPDSFQTEEWIAKRDAASGVPVVSNYSKQSLASSLRPVFASPELGRALETGLGTRWAAFMTGSLGRMGTAIVGNCSFRGLILADATATFLRRAVDSLARHFAGAVQQQPDSHPALVIGKDEEYDPVMEKVRGSEKRWELLRHLVLSLQNLGIGLTPEDGIATVELVPVEGPVGDSTLFELLKNGFLLAESGAGARSTLVKDVIRQSRGASPEDAGRALLNAQVSFLRNQRARLEWLKRRMRTPRDF